MGKEDEVKLIAYSIWEKEGSPAGLDLDHWFRAEIIWEQNQKKPTKQESKTEQKQAVKTPPQARVAKKKTKKP
ncbi:MAG TPA: DUF2934 domain-containing protein [Dehalococcoidales bacterium]|nr:DUF2934 domain-containing protein [Dehalococcoidales bacterium]